MKLFMSEVKAESLDDVTRRGIRRMVAGGKGFRAERLESIRNDGAGGFLGETLAPKFRTQMKAQFMNFLFQFIRTQTGATDVLAV